MPIVSIEEPDNTEPDNTDPGYKICFSGSRQHNTSEKNKVTTILNNKLGKGGYNIVSERNHNGPYGQNEVNIGYIITVSANDDNALRNALDLINTYCRKSCLVRASYEAEEKEFTIQYDGNHPLPEVQKTALKNIFQTRNISIPDDCITVADHPHDSSLGTDAVLTQVDIRHENPINDETLQEQIIEEIKSALGTFLNGIYQNTFLPSILASASAGGSTSRQSERLAFN